MEENNTTNAAKKRRIGPSGYDSTITDEIRSASGSSQSSQFTEMNDSKVISSDVVGFMDSSVLSPLTDTIAASDFNNDKEFVTDRSSFSNFMQYVEFFVLIHTTSHKSIKIKLQIEKCSEIAFG